MKKFTRKIMLALCVVSVVGSMTACGLTGRQGTGFEELKLECNMEEDVQYDYVSCLSDDTSQEVVMRAIFSDYVTYPHPEKEGYELRNVNLTITLGDLNQNATAVNSFLAFADYYSLDSKTPVTELDLDAASGTGTVNIDDTEYEISYEFELVDRRFSGDGNTGYMDFTFEYEVPAGYDGIVIALYNHANAEKATKVVDLFDEDTLFFRLDSEGIVEPSDKEVTEVTPKGEVVTVETEFITYDKFEHVDKYINPNIPLAEAYFYIPDGRTVTREEMAHIFDLSYYYDESQEYTYSEESEQFTVYILNNMVEVEHLTEDYMWNTLVECFNTMSYNEVLAVVEEASEESSEAILKRYACEYLKMLTDGYVWTK